MNTVESDGIPGGRWLFGSAFVHAVAEFSAWVTVLVVAFGRGGTSAAGLAITAQLVPAALLAPVVAAAGDRFPRHRVLAVSFAIQAVSAAAITFALLANSPLALGNALAAVFTVATIPVPACVASLLVHHARTPTQLTRWNITRSSVRACGSLSGPLLQRSCAETMTSRAYGVLDSTALVAAAIGAARAGQLIDDGDLTRILVAFGIVGAIVLVGGSLRLWITECTIRTADPARVSSLRSVSLLEQLPQPTLERLALTSERRSVPADNAVVVEGEVGDEFFVLLSGDRSMRARSHPTTRLHQRR